MSATGYEETPFRWYDSLPPGEGERAWWQGCEGEAAAADALRRSGWKVTNMNAEGSHFLGYDLLIQKEGKRPIRAEVKTQAGRYKDGSPCPTWFCELEAGNGKPADWRRPGAETTHIFALNREQGTINIFDRNILKGATMSGRITRHNGCPGRLVPWQDRDSGWILSVAVGGL